MKNVTALSMKEKRFSFTAVKKDFCKYKYLYIMILPVLAYYIVFHYIPMYGIIIAFKNYLPSKGFLGGEWVGFDHFISFFQSPYFFRVLRNTLQINFYDLLFGFPAPIILALLLNEVKSTYFKRTVQTVTYMPHFLSIMVLCGLILDFTSLRGIFNDIVAFFGGQRVSFMLKPEAFKTIYVSSSIWKEIGWGAIIYIAALSGVDSEQYEAATIDGANRWKQLWNVTIPGIMPTIVILLILRIGQMMNLGFEKIILLYNPSIYETADVISSYVYRVGIIDANFSFSAAVGLFNSIINFILIIAANKMSKKLNETSLW